MFRRVLCLDDWLRVDPTLQIFLYETRQHGDVLGRFVERGDVLETFTARLFEYLLILHCNFFQGFQAIRSKSRTDHLNGFNALAGKRFQHLVGVGLQPLFTTEAGLKHHLIVAFSELQRLGEQTRRLVAFAKIRVPAVKIALGYTVE